MICVLGKGQDCFVVLVAGVCACIQGWIWNGIQTVEDGDVHQEYGWTVSISSLGLIGYAWMNELMD